MSSDQSAIEEMFRHNLWANLSLLDECLALDEQQLATSVPGTAGSIYDTWLHLADSEEWYLQVLSGQPCDEPFVPGERPSLPEIKEHLQRSGDGLAHLGGHVSAQDTARWIEGDNELSMQAIRLVVQAINHAVEHRTHIKTILSQLGFTPPGLSAWGYDETHGMTKSVRPRSA